MSDTSQGNGWWQASDDKWYAPEDRPNYRPPPPVRPSTVDSDGGSAPQAQVGNSSESTSSQSESESPAADPAGVLADGWRPDPTGRHQERQYSNGKPSDIVRDGEVESLDPMSSGVPALAPSASALTGGPVYVERDAPIYRKKGAWAIAGAVVVLLVGAMALFGGSPGSTLTAATVPTSNGGAAVERPPNAPSPTTTEPPTTTTTTTPPPPPTTTSPPVTTPPTTAPPADIVATYVCTGSTIEGVDITYGTSTIHDQAPPTLPFSATLQIPSDSRYAVVNAQLQGDGSITCTTSVTWGPGLVVTQTATASGGYNIAGPQVCGGFSGGFRACG